MSSPRMAETSATANKIIIRELLELGKKKFNEPEFFCS